MTIAPKLFSRLTTSLEDYRAHPGPKTEATLNHDEQECDWPWRADAEQQAEWQRICNNTRSSFEQKVTELKAVAQ